MRFRDIPQFISDGSYQVNMSWEYLIEWLDQRVKEEGLQLNPDFQRGHVWTEEQQIKFLEFILQGGKTGRTLYFNDPYWHSVRPKTGYADFVCVDGLQRITAIQMNRIHVVDIAENFNNKSGENSKVVLYRKNKDKKILQSFHDVLISTLKERK